MSEQYSNLKPSYIQGILSTYKETPHRYTAKD